jgi:hypothetical protein
LLLNNPRDFSLAAVTLSTKRAGQCSAALCKTSAAISSCNIEALFAKRNRILHKALRNQLAAAHQTMR